MAFDLKDYPPNWTELSRRIRFDRAGGQCECTGECGLHREHPGPRRCTEKDGAPAKWAGGKIMLTVMHLCHTKTCADETHLKAACQRCHLRYDILLHTRNRIEKRDAETGQHGLALGDKPNVFRLEAPEGVRHGSPEFQRLYMNQPIRGDE